MFLTGFSSPFISIFLAVILPWLIIIFGKETGQQIISDTKIIFHIEETQSEKKLVLQKNYTFTQTTKKGIEKQVSAFCQSDKNYISACIIQPGHERPANDSILESRVSKNTGNRAPPTMFTI